MRPHSPGVGWFWRRGVPLAAASAALAATAAAAAWLLDLDATAKIEMLVVPMPAAAVVAAACAATLWACWAVAARDGPVRPPRRASRPLGRAEVLAVLAVISTSVFLAAYHLDALYRWDESHTLAFFGTRRFSAAASQYDDPNNHVLHSILVWVVHNFAGWNRVALRMPAFLSFCLFLPALWWFARQEYGPRAAVFATALVGTSPYFLAYSISARGYTLMLLLFATALLCGRALVRSPEKKGLWATWTAAIALGLYTVPLMAFPAVTTAAWMVLTRWRTHGREALGGFATRTVAWSAAAVAVALVLYLPALIASDVVALGDHVRERSQFVIRPLPLLARPVVLWREWHWAIPSWAQGGILALVVVGAGVPARKRETGTLLLATAMSLSLLLAYPFLPQSRMLISALLAFMVVAGVAAAFVVERAVDHASLRWPRVATGSRRRVLEGGALALALGTSSWWASRPDALTENTDYFRALRSLPSMATSVADQIRPGDYLAICGRVEIRAMAYVRAAHPIEEDVAWYYPAGNPRFRQRVHRVSAAKDQIDAVGGSTSHGEASPGRLFLLEALMGEGRPRCYHDRPPARQLLEADWPDHQLVAAFRAGRVYTLNEWEPS